MQSGCMRQQVGTASSMIRFIIFFFSSRRRHTRCSRDWSSDVCSSDLKEILGEALERLRETLREEGLYRAEVSAETVPHPETHQMDIMVHVKPGPRAHVASIQLTNDTAYREATLLSRFKMKPGRSEEHTSELQSRLHLVCRLLLEEIKRTHHFI